MLCLVLCTHTHTVLSLMTLLICPFPPKSVCDTLPPNICIEMTPKDKCLVRVDVYRKSCSLLPARAHSNHSNFLFCFVVCCVCFGFDLFVVISLFRVFNVSFAFCWGLWIESRKCGKVCTSGWISQARLDARWQGQVSSGALLMHRWAIFWHTCTQSW